MTELVESEEIDIETKTYSSLMTAHREIQGSHFFRITHEFIDDCIDIMFPSFQYREHQREIIVYLAYLALNSSKKYITLSAPTGCGKSFIAIHTSMLYSKIKYIVNLEARSSLILTKTIQLQEQYKDDFDNQEYGLRSLMSGKNYPCHTEDELDIPETRKFHSTCKFYRDNTKDINSIKCYYERARRYFFASPLKLLNYKFWITSKDGVSYTEANRGLIICDEGHNLEGIIIEQFEIIFNGADIKENSVKEVSFANEVGIDYEDIDKMGRFDFNESSNKRFLSYFSKVLKSLNDSIDEINKELNDLEKSDNLSNSKLLMYEEKLKPLKKKLNFTIQIYRIFSLMDNSNLEHWFIINEENHDKKKKGLHQIRIKPLIMFSKLRDLLFKETDKVILMSGTAERIKDSLKLSENEVESLEVPYVFPLENRNFYSIGNVPKLNYKNFDEVYPIYVGLVDYIISKYPKNTNTLIHTVSYKNAEEFLKMTENRKRSILVKKEEVKKVEKLARNGNILLSPAVTEGVNLANVNLQVFIKVPFPFLGDPFIKDKMNIDKDWYTYESMLDIIQGSGRAIRSANDKADTYIIDPSFLRIFREVGYLVPGWFKETIKWINLEDI